MESELYHLTRNERRHLASQTPETLARWATLLNSWEWPDTDAFGKPEPREACNKIGSVTKTKRWALGQWIEREIGVRLISRDWNSDMTDEQHQEFWVKYAAGNDPPQVVSKS